MPHISLTLYAGRSKEEIEKLSATLQQCLMETAGWKSEDISVSVEGTQPNEFASIVNEKIKTEELIIHSNFIV